jgi:hydrogenase-4 component B
VFGAVAFVAREHVDMPGPGETRPARFDLTLSDRIWDALYEPLIAGVGRASRQLNRLQFLTIRQYLSVVFGALVTLLVVLASWP